MLAGYNEEFQTGFIDREDSCKNGRRSKSPAYCQLKKKKKKPTLVLYGTSEK